MISAADIYDLKSFSVQKACTFILIFFAFLGNVLGQDPATQVPDYDWLDDENLPTVEIKLSSLSVNTEDITIAIATDPQNFIYNLTFGSGIQKRNPDGSIVNANYISGLSSPLDFAIDDNGYFYVADYSENTTCSENGKIRIFKPDGSLDRVIYTGFYRPLGLDVDSDGNIYVAEYNAPGSGCENNELSRVSIYNSAGTRISRNETVLRPYRIAVNSNKTVYLSQEGNGNPEVIILDQNLNITGNLPNIQSPGSVVVDSFDFIHVVEYAGRIDFSKFINFENLSFGEIQDIAEEIDKGTDDNAFGIKVFDPQNNFEYNHKQEIDFPIDISFNLCDKMYVDNAEVFGGNVIFVGYVPRKIEFDLEIYQRTPAFDNAAPVISCPNDITVQAQEGNDFAVVTFSDATATDANNLTITQTEGPDSGSQFPVRDTTVEFTATDICGNKSTCSFIVTVEPSEEEEDTPPEFQNCPLDISVSNDSGQCGAVVNFDIPTVIDDNGNITPTRIDGNTDLNSGDEFPVGRTTIIFQADDGNNEPVSCSFDIVVADTEDPIAICIPPGKEYRLENGTLTITPEEIDNGSYDNCGIASIDLARSQFDSPGTHTLSLIITDTAGNSTICNTNIEIWDEEQNPPDAICKNLPNVFLDDNGMVSITPQQVYDGTEDLILSLSKQDFGCDDIGDNVVTLTVEDRDTGLTATCTATITIVDNKEPIFISDCPTDITAPFHRDLGYEIPDYSEYFPATDNCDADLEVIQSPSAGTIVNGDRTVNLTYQDDSGNSVTCTFLLDLTETSDIEINCNSRISLQADDQCRFFVPDLSEEVAIYPSNAEVSQSIEQGTEIFEDTQVVMTATSVDGERSNTCTINLVLVDYIYPEVTSCIESFEIILPPGGSFEVPDYRDQITATDNCEIVRTTQRPEPGTFITEDTQVRVDFYDAFENYDFCSFNIRVLEDEDALPFTCKSSISFLLEENGERIITPVELLNVTGDISEYDFELSRNTFDCDDVTGQIPVEINYTGPVDGSCMVMVDINDVEAPIFTGNCENISINLPSGENEIDVSFEVPSATDNCSVTVEQTSGPSSGSLFSLGETEIVFTATDPSGNEATCSFFVIITEDAYVPPTVNDDEYTVQKNTILSINAPGVLANDSDIDGDLLTVFLLEGPSNGTLLLEEDGSFVYTPDPDFTGQDTFTYYATDGQGEGEATVFLNVIEETGGSGNPVAVDDYYETLQDEPLTVAAPGILSNDSDPNNEPLFAVIIVSTENGEIELNEDGSFTYTPNSGFVGNDSFQYVATNNETGYSEIATVFIQVLPDNTGDFSCRERIVLELDENGEAALSVEMLYAGNADGIEFEANQGLFTCDDLGENLVTLTYNGRIEGSCDIIVEVVDNSAPVLQVKDISRNLNEDGIAMINFEDIDNGSYDNCDPEVVYTLSKSVFSCKELGTNLVQVQAEDSSGNISSGTVTVIITDEFDTCEAPPVEGSEYIFIYPNPNTGSFKVATPADVSIQRLEVFDHRGRFIAAKDYDASVSEYAIELGPLQEAVYVVKIITNKETLNKRFIFKY